MAAAPGIRAMSGLLPEPIMMARGSQPNGNRAENRRRLQVPGDTRPVIWEKLVGVFFDVDGALGAVGDREAGLLLEARRDGAVADFMGVPVVVELEELRGDDEAAVMALALLLVDFDFHLG